LVHSSICSRNVLNICLYFCSIRLQGKIIQNKLAPLSCVLLETAHRRSTGKEILLLLYNQKIHYRAQKSSQLGSVQRQTSSTSQSIPLSKRNISNVVFYFMTQFRRLPAHSVELYTRNDTRISPMLRSGSTLPRVRATR
jgi:hypothetical protein